MSSSERDARGSYSRNRDSRRRFARKSSDYRRSDRRHLDHRRGYERRLRRRGSRSPSGQRDRRHHRSHKRESYYVDDSYYSDSSTGRTSRRRKPRTSTRRTSRYSERRGRYRDLPRVTRRQRIPRNRSSESESSPSISEYDSTVTEMERRRKRPRSGRDRSLRFRVGDKVEFKYRSARGKIWLRAEVLEVEKGMYREHIYKIYLPDLKELMHYVSGDELRVRRRLAKYEFLQKQKDIKLFKNARRQEALEELWMNDWPRVVTSRKDGNRGRSRGRVRHNKNLPRQRASSAVRQSDFLEMAAPKNRQRASSLPPTRYTWPMLLAEFALHFKDKPNAQEMPVPRGHDVDERKVPDDSEEYHESGIQTKAQLEDTKENVSMFAVNTTGNEEHLNITGHDRDVQQNNRNREYYREQYDHTNDLMEERSGQRVGKGNSANLNFLMGDDKNGQPALEGPINFYFLFPEKGSTATTQRWES